MKTKQDNNVTDHISVIYNENETKLSWPIRLTPSKSNFEVDSTSHYRESTKLQYPM